MLKFPAAPSKNKEISYANAEYLGCHIFDLVGIPVQETLLGLYRKGGKRKLLWPVAILRRRVLFFRTLLL